MEKYEDIDDYGWLTKEEDCITPHEICDPVTCPYYDACYIRVVEEARGHQV